MIETQTETPDKNKGDFNRKTVVGAAAAILGVAVVGGIGSAYQHDSEQQAWGESISQEAEHTQDVLNEVIEKSHEPYIDSVENQKDLVALLPPMQDADLQSVVFNEVPTDSDKAAFLKESMDAQGAFQIGERFAVVTEEIDGKETLLVKRVEDAESEVGTVAP